MQPLTPEFQKMLEIGTLLGGVSTIGIIAFVVKAFIDGNRKKNGNARTDDVTLLLLQQQSETLKSLVMNQTTMVAIQTQQTNILGTITTNIQEVKINTMAMPSITTQLQNISTCLSVLKDRLAKGQ
jgi:hypothetical protein